MDDRPPSRFRTLAGSLQGQLLLLVLVAGILYLLTAHRPHVLAVLPFVLLLLCPLLHLFMHGGHGGHGGHDRHSSTGEHRPPH